MERDLLEAILTLGYDGVVLEGLGQGNVPPDVAVGIQKLLMLISQLF